ncbi:uncharacterized protein LTR77_004528 [Saxophila tyrrhenica]|uniref:NADP-dependent oxidoreductase domain-containing protein n=1 Tax=Saxophila tyrrhenica TaxID=1690608 RepID=A0AAV9PFJ8_9PEZI|nr:hypothetical protein LTR77_004528 [Saxophila tyrrhenica]
MAQKAQEVLSKATGGKVGSLLPRAKLGKNGPQVTRIGYGAMGLSAFYGKPKPDSERFALLDKAYNDGELFWDSADVYGDNEDLIGQWFQKNPGKRDDIFLATKFANKALPDGGRTVDSTPEYCRESIEKSLKRLGLPFVDLYYVHRLDSKTPVEKTMEVMKQLKQEGKIKYIGLSECSEDSLRRACKIDHVDAVQIEYSYAHLILNLTNHLPTLHSPFALEIEQPQINVLKACRELGCAVVAYSPIGRGMLGGTIRSPKDFEEGDFRKNAPRFSEENFPKNLQLVDKITEIATKKGCTPSQLTLAWILAQGDDFFPIPGTTNPKRLEENLGSLKVKLSKDEEQEIRKACEAAEIHGGRYPEAMSKALFADTPALNA